MKVVNFLNLGHKLSAEQLAHLEQLEMEIVEGNEELRKKLGSLKIEDYDCLDELADELISSIQGRAVLLPIGSPSFQAVLFSRMPSGITVLFSHTDRVVVEEEGRKTAIFKHKGFYVREEGNGTFLPYEEEV